MRIIVPMSWLFPSAHAQASIVPPGPLGDCNIAIGQVTWSCIPLYMYYLIDVVIFFAFGIALISIIVNGYRYALGPLVGEGTSEGAKKGIMFSLVGLAISLLAYLIVDVVFMSLTGQ